MLILCPFSSHYHAILWWVEWGAILLFCLWKKTTFELQFYMIIANSDAPITVRIPLTTIDKPLVTPSIVPISIALAVPMACEALPIAIPFAMGSSIFSSDKNFSAKMFPNTPEMIMTTTVTDTKRLTLRKRPYQWLL